MTQRDPRYDILFESVRIGPVTAKNRFFQVPHCNGMGVSFPKAMAAMRGTKAEGGWAVVCTEETDFHPSNDFSPLAEGRLWDYKDVAVMATMTDAVHRHGALAGVELAYTGHRDANLYSREVPLSVTGLPVAINYPVQARAMDGSDIKQFRRWHVEAIGRALQAGFDLIYIYVRAGASLPGNFLSRSLNQRSDEYGGGFVNRARLFKEMLEDALETAEGRAAIAVRFTIDDEPDEADEFFSCFGEQPDLWDVNIAEWRKDSLPSRFGAEAWQEPLVARVKQLTTKPVVGVGRFTSPDTMVSQVKRGILDFIGAARPSIADPFLPRKVEQGRVEDIRECIGCNICVSSDFTMVPMRCTQNPTAGEEFRKGWHPERIAPAATDKTVLVVGAGPAGLECAHALGKRGYHVVLAEARDGIGGRVSIESRLPGFNEWARVRDYRQQQLHSLAGVELYTQSALGVEHISELAPDEVVIATGARWRHDGMGRHHSGVIPGTNEAHVATPDDILQGMTPRGPVVIFDDDCYYVAGAIAEKLASENHTVTLVTPASDVASWANNTLERHFVEERLHDLGVTVIEKHDVGMLSADAVEIHHIHSGRRTEIELGTWVPVTMRDPVDDLFHALSAAQMNEPDGAPWRITRIGDCLSPSTIAAAVYAGHRFARELDAEPHPGVGFERE